jgi:hypothetical protein
MIGTNLDRLFTDDLGFRKPRAGRCHLCGTPCLEHPAWKHRLFAAWALLISFKR